MTFFNHIDVEDNIFELSEDRIVTFGRKPQCKKVSQKKNTHHC